MSDVELKEVIKVKANELLNLIRKNTGLPYGNESIGYIVANRNGKTLFNTLTGMTSQKTGSTKTVDRSKPVDV